MFRLRDKVIERETRRILYIVPEGVVFLSSEDVSARPTAVERLGFLFVIGFFPVLAHRVPVETIPQQNALEVGMTREVDAVQVKGFALLEVRAGIDRDKAWDYGVFTGSLRFEDQPWSAIRDAEGM